VYFRPITGAIVRNIPQLLMLESSVKKSLVCFSLFVLLILIIVIMVLYILTTGKSLDNVYCNHLTKLHITAAIDIKRISNQQAYHL
jgi:uncharacterized membrane protein